MAVILCLPSYVPGLYLQKTELILRVIIKDPLLALVKKGNDEQLLNVTKALTIQEDYSPGKQSVPEPYPTWEKSFLTASTV